jgi:hypothetical protein
MILYNISDEGEGRNLKDVRWQAESKLKGHCNPYFFGNTGRSSPSFKQSIGGKAMEKIDELENLTKEYGQVQDQIEIFEQLKNNLRQNIILCFEKHFGHTGHCYEASAGKLQRIIQHNLDYETQELKNFLAPIQWNIIKKEVVDTKKLNAAIELQQIKMDGKVLKQIEIDKVSFKPAK